MPVESFRKQMLFLDFLSFLYDPISSVQSLSLVQLFESPWTAAHQASLSITNSWSLLRFMSIELVMISNHLIIYCPLLLLPSVFPRVRERSSSSFPVSWLFASGCQNIGASASPSVLPNTGVGCHFLLQGIVPTQGLNPCLLHLLQ